MPLKLNAASRRATSVAAGAQAARAFGHGEIGLAIAFLDDRLVLGSSRFCTVAAGLSGAVGRFVRHLIADQSPGVAQHPRDGEERG